MFTDALICEHNNKSLVVNAMSFLESNSSMLILQGLWSLYLQLLGLAIVPAMGFIVCNGTYIQPESAWLLP